MAYLRSYKRECGVGGCSSSATKELVNSRNASMGLYCTRHATSALRSLSEREKQRDQRDREAFDERTREIKRDHFGMEA